jgi:hypothetical protein
VKRPRLPQVAKRRRGPMKSDRLARRRTASEAQASTTLRAHRVKHPIPPPPAPLPGSQTRVAVAELDPRELLRLEGKDCIAEPGSGPYAVPAPKRTSGK